MHTSRPSSHFRSAPLRLALRAGAGLLACLTLAVQAQSLRTAPVNAITAPDQLSLDGTVQAIREATLAAQVAGTVASVEIQAGDAVRAGQALLRLDGQEAMQAQQAAQALIREADAELALAQAELRRRATLYAERYISQAAYQQAQARAATARAQAAARHAQADAARTHHGYFTIQAPYDGLIGRLDAHPGDMVMPGQPLATLFDPGALRIQAAVPQHNIGQLAPQAHVQWPPGHPNLPETLPVQVLPTRDATSLTGIIRLALPPGAPGPAPGTPVRIRIDLDGTARTRLWVPAEAVVRRADLHGIYVLGADGTPRLRQVRLGPRDGDQVEILAGLAAGETVVLDPGHVSPEGRAR
ncbi:efflux RND transporter periplasmic adaptor subunit [Castellaniella sp. WN]